MPYTHRTYLGPQGLQLRKERGTTACPEKAQRNEIAVGPAGQRKTCMVKAELPEPQFPGIYHRVIPQSGCRGIPGSRWTAAQCPSTRMSDRDRVTHQSSLPGPPAVWQGKGMSGAPNHVASRYSRNHGIACSRLGPNPSPVWRRSSHSTQTPGVMPRTAGNPSPDGQAYKDRVTGSKTPLTGGRGTASTRTQHMMGETC